MHVLVTQIVDDCGDVSRIGHRGFVVDCETEGLGATVGQPRWVVRFIDGTEDDFWPEELVVSP